MALQTIFVRGRSLGSRTIETMRLVPGLSVRPHHSCAFFCMRCGDIWARFHHEAAQLTQVSCRPCDKHGDGRLSWAHEFPGDPTCFSDDWPPAAIAYEFGAWLALAERELASGDRVASPGFEPD